MIGRRSFLRRLGIGVVALTLARHLPGIAPAPMALPDPGVSTRFIQYYDADTDHHVSRFDVLYGFGTVRPDFAVLVEAS